jgi:ferredoxin
MCDLPYLHVDMLKWPQLKIEENSLEQELLEYEKGYTDESRLACQIQLNDELNNVTVKLRKDELL